MYFCRLSIYVICYLFRPS